MKKILVVDDDAALRGRCAKFLKNNGFIVIEAENGAVAEIKYKRERPDMVLLDIVMPDMDGITAINKIRQIDPQAKIVMLSAIGPQAVMEALDAGAKDFVEKPFTPTKILGVISKVLL